MNTSADINLTGLNQLIFELNDVLLGAGGGDGDLAKTIHGEARLLAWEISKALGPAVKSMGEDNVLRDAKKTFAPGPVEVFEMSKRNGRGGDSGLTWLYAGPDFLVGVPPENLQLGLSAPAMRRQHQDLKTKINGNAWARIGKRGKQVIQKWNRIIVKRAAFDSFVRAKNARVGRLRATFAYAAHMLGQKRIPSWISRHFNQVAAEGRAIYDQSKLNDRVAPSLQFGSAAPGIANYEPIIIDAIETGTYKIAAKIQDIIHGYAEDWKAGRKITRKTR